MLAIFYLIILVIALDMLWQTFSFLRKYAHYPLAIHTFDGSDQPYHPTALFIDEGWNGFRYWMALTPYPMNKPPYKDRWECPCIYSSNDGVHWDVPERFKNPLDDLTNEEISHRDFFSDPHLVLKDNRLECWYRISHHHNGIRDTYVIMKSSLDGIHWSERNVMIDPTVFIDFSEVGSDRKSVV